MPINNVFFKKSAISSFAAKTAAVLLIIVLILLFVQKFVLVSDQERVRNTRSGITQLEYSLGIFHLDNGFYPTTEQGLRTLVSKPEIAPMPSKYDESGYIKKIPKDGWKRDFIYLSPGKHGDFDIISLGADGKKGGEDMDADITNWE